MAVSPDFRDYVLEQLDERLQITSRRMFGGVGIYGLGLFFALIADDVLYFKVDAASREPFEAAGCEPFTPPGWDRPLAYMSVPAEVLDDADTLADWARASIGVAARAKALG